MSTVLPTVIDELNRDVPTVSGDYSEVANGGESGVVTTSTTEGSNESTSRLPGGVFIRTVGNNAPATRLSEIEVEVCT